MIAHNPLNPAERQNPLEIVCGLFGADTAPERPRDPKNRNAPRVGPSPGPVSTGRGVVVAAIARYEKRPGWAAIINGLIAQRSPASVISH